MPPIRPIIKVTGAILIP